MKLTARKPTEAELAEAMSRKPVYKVVRVLGSGQLKSLWVQGTREKLQSVQVEGRYIDLFALTYARRKLSSNGAYGIWCCQNMKDAFYQARGNGCGMLCAVLKAYPIGNSIQTPRGWGDRGTVLYPAIILGRQIVKLVDNRGCLSSLS